MKTGKRKLYTIHKAMIGNIPLLAARADAMQNNPNNREESVV